MPLRRRRRPQRRRRQRRRTTHPTPPSSHPHASVAVQLAELARALQHELQRCDLCTQRSDRGARFECERESLASPPRHLLRDAQRVAATKQVDAHKHCHCRERSGGSEHGTARAPRARQHRGACVPSSAPYTPRRALDCWHCDNVIPVSDLRGSGRPLRGALQVTARRSGMIESAQDSEHTRRSSSVLGPPRPQLHTHAHTPTGPPHAQRVGLPTVPRVTS